MDVDDLLLAIVVAVVVVVVVGGGDATRSLRSHDESAALLGCTVIRGAEANPRELEPVV